METCVMLAHVELTVAYLVTQDDCELVYYDHVPHHGNSARSALLLFQDNQANAIWARLRGF